MSEQPVTSKSVDVKESNNVLIISGIVIVIFVVALLTNGFGLFNRNNNSNVTVNGTGNIPLNIGASPVLGNVSAPVTIYIFSDFSCPYCAASEGINNSVSAGLKSQDSNWLAPLPEIRTEYVDTGKVKLVWKWFYGHTGGEPAQSVAWCLNDQGLFWQFHDQAFNDQQDVENLSAMQNLASDLGANMSQLQNCLNSSKYNYEFDQDSAMGTANGITGTPTFFINGQLLEGAQSFSAFQTIINNDLTNS